MLNWELAPGSNAFTDSETDAPARDLVSLWKRSAHPSAFAAPHTLRYLAQLADREGSRPLAVRGLDEAGHTAAFWPLVENQDRIGLLQGFFSDHATALYRPEVAAADLAAGLEQAIANFPARSLYFGNLPAFEHTCEATTLALAASGWSHRTVEANVDPVLYEAKGPDLAQRLESHVRGKSLRNYANRLARQTGYRFEVQDDDDGLDEWAEAFCDCHDWRWTRTDTPSEFEEPGARAAFVALLRTWAAAGVLLRCSICLGDERIAFAVLLRSGDRLVYHRIAHSPAHEKTSAATVLVRNIVLWMAQTGHTTLDFGIGGEAYKLRFANRQERLSRIYASPARFSRTLFEAQLDALIRSSPSLEDHWDRVANKWVRGNLVARLRTARIRARQLGPHRTGTDQRSVLPPDSKDDAPARAAFSAPGSSESAKSELAAIALVEVIGASRQRYPLKNADRARFYEARQAGWRPVGRRQGKALHQWAWLQGRSEQTPERVRLRAGPTHDEAETIAFLKALRAYVGPGSEIIATSKGNGSYPLSVLRAAGFEPRVESDSESDPG